jgi:hypothetical protein
MENGITLTGPLVFFLYERSAEEAVNGDREGSADIDMAFPVPPGSMPGTGMRGGSPAGWENGQDRSKRPLRGLLVCITSHFFVDCMAGNADHRTVPEDVPS